jgi:23S rRNA (pseudouridine1915-N3)-methyltransferase
VKIIIIAVGRIGRDAESDLIERYIKRCPWNTTIIEVEERRPIKGDERKAREGDKILGAIPDGAHVMALDEHGKVFSSVEFAQKIEHWQGQALGTIVFIIGGADGLDKRVLDRANGKMAFGKMTWPHMMVRAMLVEQIYRASTIIAGHPYHKV